MTNPVPASRADIARLFGRAAFGATGADLNTWEGRPYAEAVDSLFPPGPPGTIGRLPHEDEGERILQESQTTDVYSVQRWWLERMRITPYPLEERMVLFWHDHFATAYLGEPDAGMLAIQNQTLRMHALGNFRDLANAMTIDAAMLVWLNGIANRTEGVNENYAREFFELFTLGVVPQAYTETDIRQAAKVFTGFLANVSTRQPVFVPTRHDTSVKTVLGRSIGGHLPGSPEEAVEYKQVTEAALAHDSGRTAARFVAYKLVKEFGYQPHEADLDGDPVIADVAAALRAGWDVRAAVRTLLLHPGWRFAQPSAGGDLVRSPVELVVHAAKVLAFPSHVPYSSLYWPQVSLQGARQAGQAPLEPPNVSGWPNGLGWLSQTSTLGRYDMLNLLVTYWRNLLMELVAPMPASGDLDWWAWYMGLPGFSTNTTLRLQEYLADPGTTAEIEKQLSMFVLVGTSPDWQVM